MKTYIKILAIALVSCITFNSCVSANGIDYKKKKEANNSEVTNKLDHSSWDKLLKANVQKDGLVDYKGFKSDVDALNTYIVYLGNNVPSDSWSYEEQLAYFINVYNANTIKLIVDNYPLKSIKDIDATISPFLKPFIPIGNKTLSLADVEKGILQKMNESRIHFAINCASISCPKLMQDAYTAENVEDLMEQAATEFINSDKNEISADKAQISEIFKWYKKDFLKSSTSIIEYINKYSNNNINQSVEITYKDYDWNLNEAK